jgi:hypothetical protein
MSLSKKQIQNLVALVSTTNSDVLTCDDCFNQIGEFAERSLLGRELSDGMLLVQRHLEQCPCCKDEYEALLESLKALNDG